MKRWSPHLPWQMSFGKKAARPCVLCTIMNVEVAMLTGDSEDVAKAVADELGIDQYFAEVLPADKDQKVIELQRAGQARRHGW